MTPLELNYNIYNKELLGIVAVFKVTIAYLKYSLLFISLFDIKPIIYIIKIQLYEYFCITKPIKEFVN